MSKFTEPRVLCEDCGWEGPGENLRSRVNPWNSEKRIDGCPECGEVREIIALCQVYDCGHEAETAVTFSGDKIVRSFCRQHYTEITGESPWG